MLPLHSKILGFALTMGLALGAACKPPYAVSATVESRRVVLSAEIAARVARLPITEGTPVQVGELLVELDCDIPKAQLKQAEGTLKEAEARLALLLAGARDGEIKAAEAEWRVAREALAAARTGARPEVVAQLEAALKAIQARLAHAESQARRLESLRAEGTASPSQADAARAERDALLAEQARIEAQLTEARHGARSEDRKALEARVAQAQARLDVLREGARDPEVDAARGALLRAEGARDQAQTTVERCRIVAPVAGTVDIVAFEEGEWVPVGASVVGLARAGDVRIRTFAPQRLVVTLKPGMTLPFRPDGASEPIAAAVVRVHDEAEFAPGNIQTPEDRMLLVYQVELQVAESTAAGRLRPGMTGIVDFSAMTR